MPLPIPTLPRPRITNRVLSAAPDSKGWSPPVLQIHGSTRDAWLHETEYVQRGGDRLMIGDMNAKHENMAISDCVFRFLQTATKGLWCSRMYGMTAASVRRSVFGLAPKEHNVYWELGGGETEFEECTFDHGSSQALQQRNHHVPMTSSPYHNLEKQLVLRRCNMLEASTIAGTRSGFAFSPKNLGPNGSVLLEDVFIQTAHGKSFNYNGQTYNVFGGVCAEFMESFVARNLTIDLVGGIRNEAFQAFDYSAADTQYEQAPQYIDIDTLVMPHGDFTIRSKHTKEAKIRRGIGAGNIVLKEWKNNGWRVESVRPITAGLDYVR